MKAVIKVGGKQVLASLGDNIYVEKINGNVGDTVRFNEVLMLDNKVGNPYVDGAIVEGKIERILQACKFCGLKPCDKFIRVLVLISRHPQFKWKEFMQKVEYQRDKCYKCSTTSGYIKMLENIYNNKRRNKIEFDEEKLRNSNGNN